MLNWVLNRNLDSASGGGAPRDSDDDDTTQFEAPDTPAPVFAARAIKNAFFGTPARPDHHREHNNNSGNGNNPKDNDAVALLSKTSRSTVSALAAAKSSTASKPSKLTKSALPADAEQPECLTPTKPQPQGILLTPGSGTSKQKRVSFGRDVVDNGSRTNLAGKVSGPWGSRRTSGGRRTRFMDLLESSRRAKPQPKAGPEAKARVWTSTHVGGNGGGPAGEEDDSWEEEENEGGEKKKGGKEQEEGREATKEPKTRRKNILSRDVDSDEDDNGSDEDDEDDDPDVTTDLNEPHSRSGKYWKENFDKYRNDTRTEIDKLLRYKRLAKAYARQKETEIAELAEKLTEEQQRVIHLEKGITESASQIAARRLHGQAHPSEADQNAEMKDLTEQTVLVVEHKSRVQELEEKLEELLRGRGDGGGDDAASSESGSGTRRRVVAGSAVGATSPQTQRTLLETQKELRKARTQIREIDKLRDQVRLLRSELDTVDRRAARFEEDNKRLAEQIRNRPAPSPPAEPVPQSENPKLQELRARLREAEEESKRKDEELKKLRAEYQALMEAADRRDKDQIKVLETARARIDSLQMQVKEFRAGNGHGTGRLRRGRDLDMAAPVTADREEEPVKSLARQLSASSSLSRRRRGAEPRRSAVAAADDQTEDDVSADPERRTVERYSSRTLRDKYREGPGSSDSSGSALSELGRPNDHTRNNLDRDHHHRNHRVSLEPPSRWQRFIPRSPRNPAYRASITAATAAARSEGAATIGGDFAGLLHGKHSRPNGRLPRKKWSGEEDEEDGGASINDNNNYNDDYEDDDAFDNVSRMSQMTTPRRVAAVARLERKHLERRKAASAVVTAAGRPGPGDKENIRP